MRFHHLNGLYACLHNDRSAAGKLSLMAINDNIVDDQGTDQQGAREMLRSFCERGFGGDLAQAALVLGRPAGELQQILDDQFFVDDDLAMKIKGIAQERNIDINGHEDREQPERSESAAL